MSVFRLLQTVLLGTLLQPLVTTAQLTSRLETSPRSDQEIVTENPAEPVLILLDVPTDKDGKKQLEAIGGFSRYEVRRARTQSYGQSVTQWLTEKGIQATPFWIVPSIRARIPDKLLHEVESIPGVKAVIPDLKLTTAVDALNRDTSSKRGLSNWGQRHLDVQSVWNLGIKGAGIRVGIQDTGIQWDHPVLRNQYTGWNGSSVDHNYAWHDAIHEVDSNNTGPNPCGLNLSAPCDDHKHGTYVTGIIAGDDQQGTITGIAPEVEWMGCRNMERALGTISTYLECFQWFLAPTDLAGLNPDPSRAPHIISNSWSCPASEGCTPQTINVLDEAIRMVKDAGILVVASAGNEGAPTPTSPGPSCGTISRPPAMFADAFVVGAIDSTSTIATFSSRGPTPENLLKPDVVAPGVEIFSSSFGSGYTTLSGTSAAAPFVAGAAALLLSYDVSLIGDPGRVEQILKSTATPLFTTDGCGGDLPTSSPNHTYGFGSINIMSAINSLTATNPDRIPDRGLVVSVYPNPFVSSVRINVNLPSTDPITVTMYDLLGRKIDYVAESQVRQDSGSFIWTPGDIPSGLYIITVQADDSIVSQPVFLQR